MLHFAGQNKIPTAFTFYIFLHSPNSTTTSCLRHLKIYPILQPYTSGFQENFWSDISKIPPSGRRTACISDAFTSTFHIFSQPAKNTKFIYILHFLNWSFGPTYAFYIFWWLDWMITSTFFILHLRERARCLHSASTVKSWKRRPTSIYIQCTEGDQNSAKCIYIQHFRTPRHTPGFGIYPLT